MLHPNLTIKMGDSITCFIWHPHKHNQQMKLGDSTICCMDNMLYGIPTTQARRKRNSLQLA